MKDRIAEKQQAIGDLQLEIAKETIADFYETHDLKEGQHFSFDGKECVGVEMSADWECLKTFPITAKGDVSKKGLIIYGDKSIKPL